MQDYTEEGMGLIPVYGRDKDEVIEKLAWNNAHAQEALARHAPAAAAATPAAPKPAAPPARKITADQIMQATQDLNNPAKAASAVSVLLESATGIDPVQLGRNQFTAVALNWETSHPEFYPHPGNRQLLGNRAILLAGKPGQVTAEIMTRAFQELKAEDVLFEDPQSFQPATPSALPGENRVQSIERPRGTRFATGASSRSFSAPQSAPTRTLKWTEEQILNMSEKERRQVFDTPEYIRATEYYFGGARATA
jgi:hypothetical protein